MRVYVHVSHQMNKRKGIEDDHLPSAAALAAALALDRNFPSGPVTDAIAAAASAVAAAAATGTDTMTVPMPNTPNRRRRIAVPQHDFNGDLLGAPKKFACDGCDATFSAQSHLITHHRSHTGEKPYVCEDCSLAFAQKNNLVRHRRGTPPCGLHSVALPRVSAAPPPTPSSMLM